MYFRNYQEEQQEKSPHVRTNQPIGNIRPPNTKDGQTQCQLCDQLADEDFVKQDVYICHRCADLIANIHYSDFGRSTFGFATWCREDLFCGSRKQLKQSVRTKVFERDLYRCINCQSAKNLCVDHIHPVSRGGSDEFENLQTLCKSCNSSKGNKTMSEWLEGSK